MINSRGEVEMKYILGIIILIASFTALLVFFFMLDFDELIKGETCKTSIILKSTPLGKLLSANCPVRFVCMNLGGPCEELDGADYTDLELVGENLEFEFKKEIIGFEADAWSIVYQGAKGFPGDGECLLTHVIYFGDDYFEEYKKQVAEGKSIQITYGGFSWSVEVISKNQNNERITKDAMIISNFEHSGVHPLVKDISTGDIDFSKPLAVFVTGDDPAGVFLMEYGSENIAKLECDIVNFA